MIVGSAFLRRVATVVATLVVLLYAAAVEAAKVRLTITSEPSGATIELNGQFIGTTPHVEEMDDWAFKGPRFLFSKYLGEDIRLRVWKDGFFPKELRLTSGPFVWTNLNRTATHIYYTVTSTDFHVLLEPIHAAAPAAPPAASASRMPEEPSVVTGSSFLISRAGYVVTNFHVVKGASRIAVRFPNQQYTRLASIAVKDETNDLAVLQLRDFDPSYVTGDPVPFELPSSAVSKMGQSAYTVGFPLGDVMGSTPRLSSGLVSSVFGLGDDPRLLQISNPVQPGNSGGPLINENGELIGVVVSGLSAKYFYENAGIIPQNVNFAVKSVYLRSLIELLPDAQDLLKEHPGNSLKGLTLEKQIEKLTPFVAEVTSYLKDDAAAVRVNTALPSVESARPKIVTVMLFGETGHAFEGECKTKTTDGEEARSLAGVLPANFKFTASSISCRFTKQSAGGLLQVQFVVDGRSIKVAQTTAPHGSVSLAVTGLE